MITANEKLRSSTITDNDKQYEQRKPKDKEKYKSLGRHKATLRIQAKLENKSDINRKLG